MCNSPPEVTNARKVIEADNAGGRVEYSCLRGYVLRDPKHSGLDCQNGKWIGELPSCSKLFHSYR